ncbi:hypothetical protein OUZ56_014995 [Daphnia magna]|uniref:Uncharacterized protein n=1 Tax=Daphnia magna TaxID=35525 RepID=A0ABR0ALV2_9CRUS|nr:hypothetical protein OUZ56_014995 [Daphnia magna]
MSIKSFAVRFSFQFGDGWLACTFGANQVVHKYRIDQDPKYFTYFVSGYCNPISQIRAQTSRKDRTVSSRCIQSSLISSVLDVPSSRTAGLESSIETVRGDSAASEKRWSSDQEERIIDRPHQ